MYQLQHNYTDDDSLRSFVCDVRDRLAKEPSSKALFRLFNDTSVRAVTDNAASIIRNIIPEAQYVGCSTSGNISDGRFSPGPLPNLTIGCEVFDDPDTKVEVFQFPLDEDHCEATAQALLKLVDERPWVKAIGMLTTIIGVRMEDFCNMLDGLRKEIVLFGAGALTTEDTDMFKGLPYVFSSAGEAHGHSIVFALYGGENFHVITEAVIGWNPIGKPLKITRAEGPVLYELDWKPAFDLYHHYLKIENDEHFSESSILFPIAIEHGDTTLIKAPVSVGKDGSITLTSHLEAKHKTCRLAYGDPATILLNIRKSAEAIRKFAPQAIVAYSCAARLMYWGSDYISRETLPFNDIAPVTGFYSGGEFERHKGELLHHNVAIVLAGMREGEPGDVPGGEIEISESEFSRQMAIVNTLAALVGATSSELETAYYKMQVMAKIDGLTDLFNRREMDERIEQALDTHVIHGMQPHPHVESSAGALERPCVIMLDIDDFKVVNDAYGHKAGDDVLKGLGALMKRLVDEENRGISGRWGGEEFMILLPHCTLDEATELAEELCRAFPEINFPASGRHTVSVGVAQALPGETADLLCQRVDKALYAAKRRGKNCVIVA